MALEKTKLELVSLVDICKSLNAISEQIERAESLLKDWPHSQSDSVFVELLGGTMVFRRPHIVFLSEGRCVKISELASPLRIKAVKEIPTLIETCESIASDFLKETKSAEESLRQYLDRFAQLD
jgi:hypothetical protein